MIRNEYTNGNQSLAPQMSAKRYPVSHNTGINETGASLPVKLLIAKDMMAAHVTGSVYAGFPYKSEEVAAQALKDAEALLNAYNNS